MSIFDKYDLVEAEVRPEKVELPEEGLILIQGSSGSGKTTILGDVQEAHVYEYKSVIEHFSSEEEGERLLTSCGLRSIPCWLRPFNTLSNGERHRAQIALNLDRGIRVIDEFTSVVDRDTAKSLSVALSKLFREGTAKRLVIATCHKDVREWLCPDHTFDTDSRQWLERGSLRRPDIRLDIRPCDGKTVWEVFKKHHYLSHSFNKSANSWCAFWGDKLVAFTSILSFPSGNWEDGWREHRTVVLPEFQGLGIGNRLSETVASFVVSDGGRFFSKTSHPAMGIHRDYSDLWRGTSKNHMKRKDYKPTVGAKDCIDKMRHASRVCYSHEFIGFTHANTPYNKSPNHKERI